MVYLGGISMLLSVKDGTMSHRGFRRILTMCLLIVGLAFILFILSQAGNSEAATIIPGGPVSDALYGTWNNASAPYFIEGDIWVPNGAGPAGTLTIDGTGGPVDIYFNGDYSLRIGDPGSANPAILTVNGVNRNIRFTRNSTGILWDGIKFENSATLASFIQNANITYVSGPNETAVWLNGTSGININDNEIGHIVGTTRTVGIGLYDPTDANTTDSNFITGNYIHNISASSPSTEWTCAIRLLSANSNIINSNVIENIDDLGPGQANGIYLFNSSINTLNSNIISLVSSIGDGGAIGIELKDDCDQNTLTLNQISIIRALDPANGNAYGVYIHSGNPFLAPDRTILLQTTVDDVYSHRAAAFGVMLKEGGTLNRISQSGISKIFCGPNGWGGSGIDVFNSPNTTVENNDVTNITCYSNTASMYGINFGTCNFGFVANNTVFDLTGNGTVIGLYLDVCFDTSLFNNHIENITGKVDTGRPSAVGIYSHMNINCSYDDITILNVTSLIEDSFGIFIDGSSNESLMNVFVDEITSDMRDSMGLKFRFSSFITLNNAEISDVTAMNGFAEGLNVETTNNDTYIDITISGITGSTTQFPETVIGMNLFGVTDTEIVSLEINTVTNLDGDGIGMRIFDSENLDLRDSRITEVSSPAGPNPSIGILHWDSTSDMLTNIKISDVDNVFGPSFGIHVLNTIGSVYTDFDIMNITSGAGNLAVGVNIDSGSSSSEVYDSTIMNVTTIEESAGIFVQGASNNVILENNTIWDTQHGVKIFSATNTYIGNHSIFDTQFGIFTESAVDLTLYNNHIHGNSIWGIAMNQLSNGMWIVDSEANLIDNPAFFNGTIHIIRGKLTFYNVSSTTIRDVIVEAGKMELGGSPNSVISNNVWVNDILYINSSKWQINVTTANGEYGIQVNASGAMYVQDNGTGPSTITDGPHDNDAGILGVDDFRYYFKVLLGSTFRMTDSQVSEVGWDGLFSERGLYVETMNAYITRSNITDGHFGLIILEAGWKFENNNIYDLDMHGIWVQGSIGMYLANNSINTTQDLGCGIVVLDTMHEILNNTIVTWGADAHAINLTSTAANCFIIDNTIETYGTQGHGIFLDFAFAILMDNNEITLDVDTAIGILIESSTPDWVNNNTITGGFAGIHITSSSLDITVFNNTITSAQTGIIIDSGATTVTMLENNVTGNFDGISISGASNSNILELNRIFANINYGVEISGSFNCQFLDNWIYLNDYGIYSTDSGDNTYRDNIIFDNTFGIYGVVSSELNLFNNDIYDNTDWGIWMDLTSSGTWFVDSPASFLRNDGLFIGPLTVGTNGNMLISQATLQIHRVQVDGGGILQAKDAKNSIISWNVSISGLTTLDNATWEMNCTYDGQFKIEVNPGGNLQVINGSLITAHDPEYRYDFWINGTANFNNCTIEYVGYGFDEGSIGVAVTTDSVQFDNVVFNNCTGGIIAFASHPQIKNIESNNCTMTIALIDADTLVITNVTIRDVVIPPGGGAASILIENYSSVSLYDIDIRRSDPGAAGIMFVNSTDGYVENVYIQNITAGFIIQDSQVAILDSETIGGHSGFRMSNGADVTVINCFISENSDVGFDFRDSAGYLFNCTISNNNIYGINLNNSSPMVDECNILGHDLGIISSNSSSPLVVNTTISSINTDFHVEGNSHPVALNCTFTNTSTAVWDTSTLAPHYQV
jgi:parallel beta-helix repeat protein